MEPIFPKRPFLPGSSKRFHRNCSKTLARRPVAARRRARPHHPSAKPPQLTMPTKTKTRVLVGPAETGKKRLPLLIPAKPTIPSRISPNSSPHGARRFLYPKFRSNHQLEKEASGPDKKFAIPNTARERSTSAKEKVKMPRLRYNSRGLG